MLHNLVSDIGKDLKSFLNTVQAICEVVNTPRSLAVSILLQYGEWQEYMNLSMDPSTYEDPQHFAKDYLVTEIVRKCEYLPLGVDKAAVALAAFMDSEIQCENTNERLRTNTPSWYYQYQRNVRNILGPLDQTALEFIERRFSFGPGASTGVRGTGSTSSDKYDKELHLTYELIPFVKSIIGDLWWDSIPKGQHTIVNGSKFTTVPKSAKTDRGICIEPTLNMYVQKGIGAYIRHRLGKFGIDINSQERNRSLAAAAYDRKLATIDLSAASDSLSTELIVQYFPDDWYELLYLSRSHRVSLPDGSVHELEKWSSMGNGYTFELETLVFWALCKTIIPRERLDECSVFGDDIIVPQEHAQSLIDALDFLGFKVNTSKSFLAGNFFESCGHDYFKGLNVRPFYLKGSKDKIPTNLQVANKLRLWSRRINGEAFCDIQFKPIWLSLVKSLPRYWRKTGGPVHAGDSCVIRSYEECPEKRRVRDGLEGRMYLQVSMKPVETKRDTFGVLLSAYAKAGTKVQFRYLNRYPVLFGYENVFSRGREPLRGYLREPRTRWTLTQSWSTGLSWE